MTKISTESRFHDPAYHRGLELFNAQEFYDAHEILEDVWRAAHGLEKKFLQGLIQVAVAFHHHSTGNLRGATSLMARGCRNLHACPPQFGGIRLAALLESLATWQAALADNAKHPAWPTIKRLDGVAPHSGCE